MAFFQKWNIVTEIIRIPFFYEKIKYGNGRIGKLNIRILNRYNSNNLRKNEWKKSYRKLT